MSQRRLPWDWHDGTVPDNVVLDPDSYLETSYGFRHYHSRRDVGLSVAAGAGIYATMFDVGEGGRVTVGKYALLNPGWIICDGEVDIGDYALISWSVTIMDTRRLPSDLLRRRQELDAIAGRTPRRILGSIEPRPVRIGANAWIGFDAIILPGVRIGEGAVIGAKSVVCEDVPDYAVAAGNPAVVRRRISPPNSIR